MRVSCVCPQRMRVSHSACVHACVLRVSPAAMRVAWKLEIVRRPAGVKGFVLLPKRWVVERTFSWLTRWRRLSRDYEHRTDSSESMVHIALIGRMLRYLEPDKSIPPFNYS